MSPFTRHRTAKVMRWAFAASFAVAELAAAGSAAAQVNAPSLKTVRIDGPRLRLSDLVPQPSAELDLGPAPPPGTARVLTRSAVLSRASTDLPPGPAAWRIETRAQRLSCEQWRELVRGALGPQLRPGLEITSIDCGGVVMLPRGTLTASATLPTGQRIAGRITLPLQLQVESWPPRSVIVSIEVGGSIDTVVAVQSIAPGEALRPDMLHLVKHPANTLPLDAISTIDELAGQQARVAIQPGLPLRRAQLRATPLVKQGDRVRLLLRSAGVRLTTTALARQDGGIGDMILVLCSGTQRLLEARVMSPELVEVEL